MNQFGTGKEVASMSLLLIFTISIDVLRLTRLERLSELSKSLNFRVFTKDSLANRMAQWLGTD